MATRESTSWKAALIGLCIALGLAFPAHATFLLGSFLTYTQADWGDIPGDPGATAADLLTNNYDSVYAPFGVLEIGALGNAGFSIGFTNVSSVSEYLPAVGPIGTLDADLADPMTSASGSFGGDVLALRLNIDFSDANLLANASGTTFGDLVLTGLSGSVAGLNGLTVRQVYQIESDVLGTASTAYTVADMDLIARQLSGAFFDGPSEFAQSNLALPGDATTVPEPTSIALVIIALLAMLIPGTVPRRHWRDLWRRGNRYRLAGAFEDETP